MKEDNDYDHSLQEEISRIVEIQNATPDPGIDNLSPADLFIILYDTFGEESPIGFKRVIQDDVFSKVPFLELTKIYLSRIEDLKGLKLTTRGNLPRKLCLDLYNTGIIKEDYIETGIVKLSKEADSVVLQNIKIIAEFSGLTKKRNNKLTLTKKGKRLLSTSQSKELFKELFMTNYQKFNIGFHDGYSDEVGIQKTFGFALYLLLRYGNKKRSVSFYANKQIKAFPFELDFFDEDWSSLEEQYENCFEARIFERFLAYFGLIDYKNKDEIIKHDLVEDEKSELKASPIFFEIFELRKDKFKFLKTEFFA